LILGSATRPERRSIVPEFQIVYTNWHCGRETLRPVPWFLSNQLTSTGLASPHHPRSSTQVAAAIKATLTTTPRASRAWRQVPRD